ncbi:MAG: hypothetical protein AAFW46_07635 [Pseudomonadota bacterium]
MAMKTWFAALMMSVGAAFGGTAAIAGEADVVAVEVMKISEEGGLVDYRFDVTVAHADTGWDHYADAFEIIGPDGTVLGVRELLHPHVDEQPFTRSLRLQLPTTITTVTVQANDVVHGLGGRTQRVTLPR